MGFAMTDGGRARLGKEVVDVDLEEALPRVPGGLAVVAELLLPLRGAVE